MAEKASGGGGGGEFMKLLMPIGVCLLGVVILYKVVEGTLINNGVLRPYPAATWTPPHGRGVAHPRTDTCPPGQESLGYRIGPHGQKQHGCRKVEAQQTETNPCPAGQKYLGTRIGPNGHKQYGCRKITAQ